MKHTIRARFGAALVCLAILALAALPRLGQLEVPLTEDEPDWFERSARFARALREGDAESTFRTGHPGVTSMWLGALGMGLERAAALSGERLTLLSEPEREAFLGARRAMALASLALLGIVILLLARLFGLTAAALAGLLLALDPWLVGHSRVLHLDGLFSALVAICVLACLARWRQRGGLGYLALAGLAAGLAALTKSTALAVLPPILVMLALAAIWQARSRRPWVPLADLVAIGALGCLVGLLVWPALRLDPLGTVDEVIRFSVESGTETHDLGSYFLGQAVNDPGLTFYLLVLAFRLSPLLLLGLLLWLGGLVLQRATRAGTRPAPTPRTEGSPLTTPVGAGLVPARVAIASPGNGAVWLVVCALLVVLVMSVGAKKQDRYALPAVVLLAGVSAVGFQRLVGRVGVQRLSAPLGRVPTRALVIGGVGLLQLALCAGARPYYLSFYSPLLGGAPAARQVMLIGWGEGLDHIAEYVNHPPPDVRVRRVAATRSIRGPFRSQVRNLLDDESRPQAEFLVTYVNAIQRGQDRPPESARPLLIVRIDGVEYAGLYALP